MAKILEVVSATNHGSYCIIEVLLDNQELAQIYIGGHVQAYYDSKNGVYKAYVKKTKF